MQVAKSIVDSLAGQAADADACEGIAAEACNEQPRNFVIHVMALVATKLGDGLLNPKLVLSWLLTALGAPAFMLGLLVPIREAGSLLPQLLVAAWMRPMSKRKWIWVLGSALQGSAVLAIAFSAWQFSGAMAGWLIVGGLSVFALARSLCSVSYKDVQGKTIAKRRRGTVSGTAGSLAAFAVLLFGGLLASGWLSKSVDSILWILLVAAVLWLLAAGLFAGLAEFSSGYDSNDTTAADQTLWRRLQEQISLLKTDVHLRQFILVRALLVAIALAPPFLVLLSGESNSTALGGSLNSASLGQLGRFVLAAGLASALSSYVWGRLSDQSSRKVLIACAAIAAIVLASTATIGALQPTWLHNVWLAPLLLFILMLAYEGVRIARATHIVDMANAKQRAAYTAVANSVLGIVLLVSGLFSVLVIWIDAVGVLFIFALLCGVAVICARRLQEVQQL